MNHLTEQVMNPMRPEALNRTCTKIGTKKIAIISDNPELRARPLIIGFRRESEDIVIFGT